MSFMVATPELLTSAAGELSSIAGTLEGATAAAVSPTTGLAAAAGDEVSAAISQLFGTYGQEFQAISARGAAFHAEFVRLLNGSTAAYLGTDIANAAQNLAAAGTPGLQQLQAALQPALGTPSAAPTAPFGSYQALFNNTATNLNALGSAWIADPFPFLRQVSANQLTYAQGFATALASTIQNFPANLATLPAAIQVAFQEALSFNAAYYIQNFIAAQIGFAQTFATSLTSAVTGIAAGLPAFASGVGASFQTLVTTGNYNAAIGQLAEAYRQLLVTGYDVSNYTFTSTGDILPNFNLTLTGTAYPKLLGPLDDFFTALNIPAQEAQFLTNLMPPSTPRQIAQNFTNVLSALTATNAEAQVVIPVFNAQAGITTLTYSLPLVFTYSLTGPPFAALDAFGSSLASFNQSIATGDVLGAVSTVIDSPANILNGFLNGHVLVDDRIPVPLPDVVVTVPLPPPLPPSISFTIPLPKNGSITPHLPFNGLLVPPEYLTATVDVPGEVVTLPLPPPLPPLQIPIPGINFEGTVYGTPFMGLAPLLINYIPQQLALAIKPAA